MSKRWLVLNVMNENLMRDASGFTLLEVLISIVIFAVGLLGISSLQLKLQTAQVENYQRTQAVLLISEITERIKANRDAVADYVTGTSSPVGVGDSLASDCSDTSLTEAQRDLCEWSQVLKGSSENAGVLKLGAMEGARGCIETISPPDPSVGVCAAGSYRVTLAWQGTIETVAPASLYSCAAGQYGDEKLRRVMSSNITIGLPTCS